MMKRMIWLAGALALGSWAAAGQAADKEACGKDLVCASAPQTIVAALQKAGYKASLSKSKSTGNPMIESAAAGYDYRIFFYECEDNAHCASIQFAISFADDGTNTPELANLWNKDKRFSQMSVDEDKSLNFSYDVTTYGGLNQRNFADVIDWWATMLGQVSQFFKQQPPAK
jgi:hypothetical protein